MAIKIIEGFENRAEWYGVGNAADIVAPNQSLSGDHAIEFGKAAGAQDFAGIVKVFNGLDLTNPEYLRLFVSVYVPEAAFSSDNLTSIDVILDDSATDTDAYPNWEDTYECDAKPTLATPAWTQTFGASDVTTVGGGYISWQLADQRFFQNLGEFLWIE